MFQKFVVLENNEGVEPSRKNKIPSKSSITKSIKNLGAYNAIVSIRFKGKDLKMK